MQARASSRLSEEGLSRLRKNLVDWRVPAELVDELIERRVEASFAKGALLFSEGSSADLFACLLSGYVKVYCPIGDGGRTLMRVAGPGDVVGYADFIDERGRRARLFEAQALSKCNVALLTRDHVARLLRVMDANALLELMYSLNTFWSQKTRWFATLMGLSFWRRLEVVLTDLAARFGASDMRGILLIPELCHEDLAEMIGSSRPMVSRLIRLMMDNQLIARCGKQYLLLEKWNFDQSQKPVGHANGRTHFLNSVQPLDATAPSRLSSQGNRSAAR
jgi:CRP/FNR family transcriptional regulator, cyclic AMP receptor protein